MQTTLLELLMDWLVPIVGGIGTVLVIKAAGLTSFWWMLLVLPGALAFQWGVVLTLLAIGKLISTRSAKRDG